MGGADGVREWRKPGCLAAHVDMPRIFEGSRFEHSTVAPPLTRTVADPCCVGHGVNRETARPSTLGQRAKECDGFACLSEVEPIEGLVP
jgi:hypothetical protein